MRRGLNCRCTQTMNRKLLRSQPSLLAMLESLTYDLKKQKRRSITLTHGSLYVMDLDMQKIATHGIPRKLDGKRRYCITFRHLFLERIPAQVLTLGKRKKKHSHLTRKTFEKPKPRDKKTKMKKKELVRLSVPPGPFPGPGSRYEYISSALASLARIHQIISELDC